MLTRSLAILFAVVAIEFVQAQTMPPLPVVTHIAQKSVASPILDGQNFPDPCLLRTGNAWRAFSTNTRINGTTVNVPIAFSPDFTTWHYRRGKDAMPKLATWVSQDEAAVWAPDVSILPDGTHIMYYAAALASNPSRHCVGFATSQGVEGPYVDNSSQPYICPLSGGGAIDPSGYIDPADGRRWVVYKIDGNAIGNGGSCGNSVPPIMPTPIMLQEVDANDGHTKIGDAIELLSNGPWDGPVIEAPSVTLMDGQYVLFFSSNCYTTKLYDVSYAMAPNITGPYTKFGPLFVTGVEDMVGPGGLHIAQNGNHAMWHGYINWHDPTDACIADEPGKTSRLCSHEATNDGRGAYTALLARQGNLVTAEIIS